MNHIWKTLIEKEKQLLNEIGEGNTIPFNWDGNFIELHNKIKTLIPVDYNNNQYQLSISFLFDDINSKSFEIGFSLDGDDEQLFKSPVKFYLKILSTVLKVVEGFINVYEPVLLIFKGFDKRDVNIPGQKDRIYFSYVEKNARRLGFNYGHKKDGIILTKIR